MATYSASQLGIKPTAFQDLGWYPTASGGSYQYFKGTFGENGAIHPNSPQQGAGQKVSSEVNKQSDAAQGLKTGTIDNYLAQKDNNPASGGGGGYNGGAVGGGMGAGAGVGFSAQAPIDLPGLYEKYYAENGISDIEKRIVDKQNGFNDAQLKINDNPFLSEATRTGRIQKLTMDYNNNIKTDQDELTMKKADIDMKLSLQSKQFDINSQASQQALNQFNTLLESGALSNANGDDIANITRSTGLSSNMISSAIQATNKKNQKTQIISYDDGQTQGFVIIDPDTGQIINKQSIANSKPTKGTKGDKLSQDEIDSQNRDNLIQSVSSGTTLKSLINHFGSAISVDTIYQLYNSNSPNGKAKESLKNVKAGKFNY